MLVRKYDLIPKIQLIGDLILLNSAFFIVNYISTGDINHALKDFYYLKQFLYINIFWVGATFLLKSFNLCRVMSVSTILIMHLKAFAFHLVLIFSFIFIFKQHLISAKLFTLKYSLFVVFIFSWRIFIIKFLEYFRAKGYNYKRIVIAGAGKVGRELNNFFTTHPGYGYKCLGFFDDNEKYSDRIGNLADLESFAIEHDVDEIYCALPNVEHNKMPDLMSFADKNLIRLKILLDFKSTQNQKNQISLYEKIPVKIQITYYDKIPVLNFRKDPLDCIVNRLFKRIFDTAFSLLVIVSVFPWLFPLIAIAIKLSSDGPVLFKQLRSGRGNKSFICYKFRTMKINSNSDKLQACKNDPRITPIGKFLRKTSLDELPQFFNVLIGNMSIVGPRPHMLSHTEKYSNQIDQFMARHFVKAGITGLAQLKGFRGETTPAQMDNRVRWDLWYIENWSFYFDMKIIFLTVTEILRGKLKGV